MRTEYIREDELDAKCRTLVLTNPQAEFQAYVKF